MKGTYTVEICNNRVHYELVIRRNITIISGDSGTGKSTLIRMVDDFYNNGRDSGIRLKCDVPCISIHGRDWFDDLSKISNSIVFIDEGNRFISTHEFARAVKDSDNYYVIATRQPLPQLPYSFREIYMFSEGDKREGFVQTYNEQGMLYGHALTQSGVMPDIIITEDSNSGHDFFCEVCKDTDKECVSAYGKSKIKELIQNGKDSDQKTLIIADGAAFGSEINQVMQVLSEKKNYYIYLPESFEWLVLRAKVLRSQTVDIDEILEHTSDYVDSKQYMSWEPFFTDLLSKIANDSEGNVSYSKSRLTDFFKQKSVIEKVIGVMSGVTLMIK